MIKMVKKVENLANVPRWVDITKLNFYHAAGFPNNSIALATEMRKHALTDGQILEKIGAPMASVDSILGHTMAVSAFVEPVEDGVLGLSKESEAIYEGDSEARFEKKMPELMAQELGIAETEGKIEQNKVLSPREEAQKARAERAKNSGKI